MRIFLLFTLCLAAQFSALAQPARIILLRHGEKPPDDSKLTLAPRGRERAQALVAHLTHTPGLIDAGTPVVLFATSFGKHTGNNHTHETLTPLAQHLHLKIEAPYANTETDALARHILHSKDCRGKIVVVCWDHTHLPELAAALGVRPEPPRWKADVFDRLWVLTPQAGKIQMEDRPQKLLPGDSTH